MFEYKKTIKSIEKIEKLVNVIQSSEDNSGYRVQVSYGHGSLYDIDDNKYFTEIFVTDNYKNNKNLKKADASSNEEEVRLPCRIYGDPTKSEGIIKKVVFEKEKVIKELKENEKNIINPYTATIQVQDSKGNIIETNLITKYLKVYFGEQDTLKDWIDNLLMAKTEIIKEFNVKNSYFDVAVSRGKLVPYITKGKINLYLRSDVERFILENIRIEK